MVANVWKNISFLYQICRNCSQFSPLHSKNLDAWEEKPSRNRGGNCLSNLPVSSLLLCLFLPLCSVPVTSLPSRRYWFD